MAEPVRIALDAMGGDHGPSVIVEGAAIARERRPESRYVFFGDGTQLESILSGFPKLAQVSEVRHTEVVVRMDDKPSVALRAGRRTSSMWCAIEAVKRGEADAAVSAGNTGALMAMSKICLNTLPGIDRPALAALWPTTRGESIVLDVGATIGADAQTLVDLAIMGAAMAHILFDFPRPTIGLLNVGAEEIKGIEEVKAASRRLRDLNLPQLEYRGFVEGNDLGKGTVDVVVTEGFTGNIALKTAEGTARQIGYYLREAMGQSWRSRIGYLFARPAFETLRQKIDPRRVNGGLFLGLDGIVIKSHGGTDAQGFAGAVDIGHDMVRHRLLDRIRETLMVSQEDRDLEDRQPLDRVSAPKT